MDSFMKEFEHLKIQLEDIKTVTNNFGNKVIGSGGFGKVYQGELSHSKGRSLVAIKRLDRKFGQGDPEFWKEITMLSRYSHENLISLLGFCDEDGEKVIVYELASNGSLDRYLSSPYLTWIQRIKICLDAARGLSYLHEDNGRHQRVIHRDVKSSNILLGDEWKAKLSDMGLSKLGPANQEHTALLTSIAGTPGYVDPLYFHEYVLTKESDVYSFGVVLFEVMCGRLCFSHGYLVPMWKQSYINKKIHEIIFQYLTQQMDVYSLETFSDIAFQCVDESREKRPTMSHVVETLELALQFQQRHDLKLPEEYENILKAVGTPLRYTSLEELKVLLSNGVFLNAGKTWFSINNKGEHFVLISIKECLIPRTGKDYEYSSEFNSRFPTGTYSDDGSTFETHVRTQFLSPHITYTVNLVYKNSYIHSPGSRRIIVLDYKLDRETKTWTSCLADQRQDGWLAIELCQFTSDGTTMDLHISFHNRDHYINIEGVEFEPLEYVQECQVSDDEKQVDMQPPISHSDDDTYWEQKLPNDYHTYWEQKLPNDYQDIIKQSKDRLQWDTKKELYSIFCEGFIINHGSFFERLFNNGRWFSLDKNGKKCLMLSAREAFEVKKIGETSWAYLHENSRFGEVLVIKNFMGILFIKENKSQVLSPQTKYACYLIYKLPQDNFFSKFEMPMSVRDKYWGSYDLDNIEFWHIYLVSPQTPVIRPKFDQNTCKPLNRPKIKGLPQQRSDLWWEVQVYEFQTDTTEGVIPSLELIVYGTYGSLYGLMIQGIELRPI